jgi:membrane-bound ClpP family serine protease
MVTLIVGLFVLGLCFISLELIVPGGILGGIGLLAVLGSWALAFVEFGAIGGLLAVLVGVMVIGLSLFMELKIIPRTPLGQRLFLKGAIVGTSQPVKAEVTLVGKEGKTLTKLTPTGVVLVGGREYEGFSMNGMMEKGLRVEVVDYDNFRVRVRRI